VPAGVTILSVVVSGFFTVIFVLCLVNAVAPKWCWRTFESWKANKEPTEAYFLSRRISSIIFMIIIAAIALAPSLIAAIDA